MGTASPRKKLQNAIPDPQEKDHYCKKTFPDAIVSISSAAIIANQSKIVLPITKRCTAEPHIIAQNTEHPGDYIPPKTETKATLAKVFRIPNPKDTPPKKQKAKSRLLVK
jgi:hypothetical protein